MFATIHPTASSPRSEVHTACWSAVGRRSFLSVRVTHIYMYNVAFKIIATVYSLVPRPSPHPVFACILCSVHCLFVMRLSMLCCTVPSEGYNYIMK